MKTQKYICDICGKEIDLKQEQKEYKDIWIDDNGDAKPWSINAGILNNNQIQGHRQCLQNVDDKIVIPERISASILFRKLRGDL